MSSDKLYTYDPESKPPPFGHPLRKYWAFDDSYVNLNNGSYGAQPLPVFRDSQNIALLSEQNPDKFHRFTYLPLLEESRKLVAELIGAEHDEIVLVPNATHGINTILRNMEWRDGDILLGASTTYDAVSKTLKYLDIRFTNVPSDALLPEGFERDPNGNRFVVVIDSIVSNPGVRLPWQEMVRIAKEEGIWTVIDAAHSIGQEVNINLSATKPDFWVSNCHKWLYVKRGCAALYVPRRNQYLIKSSIPTSHDYVSPSDPKFRNVGTAFAQQHRWTGTADLSPYLSIKSALNFRKWLGGEEAINAYCHDLALKGGKKLAEVLNTRVMDDTGELTWNMTNVQLPLPVQQPDQEKIYTDEQLRKVYSTLVTKMLDEWNTCVAVFFHNGGWWARASAQVWNEISDFEYAGKALNAICKEIKDDPGSTKLDSALRK